MYIDKKDFHFELPKEQIAQEPLENRADSRLLVLNRKSGDVTHEHFYNIANFLSENDLLVLNETKVIPARLFGNKETGAKIEVLLLKKLTLDRYEVLLKPAKRVKIGERIVFGDGMLVGTLTDCLDDGLRVLEFSYSGVFEDILDRLGQMPLPHYITKELPKENEERYQTVYAKNKGSAAAPTAGLHFTPEVFKSLKEKNIDIAKVTLHVGLGTFRPIKEQNILDHKMHSELVQINEENANKINNAKQKGKRIVCVGTTSVRALESACDEYGLIHETNQETDIFIYPPYKFKICDALITNFHLPESTLLALVSAFSDRETVLNAYKQAVEAGYRFFSFGDSMMII